MPRNIVRDSTVHFSFVFLDNTGEAVTPASATVVVNYPKNDRRVTETIDLVIQDEKWIADWDSRVSDPGAVYVHAQTGGDVPVSSMDDEFRLTANYANMGDC